MFFKKKNKELYAFVDGESVELEHVPDDVFSQKMMGDGIAIQPTSGCVVAPCDARITLANDESSHAIGFINSDGVEMLIHIGLDTFACKKDVFKRHVHIQDHVKAGQSLISFDLAYFKEHGLKDIIMLVIVDDNQHQVQKYYSKAVKANEDVILEYK
ncbi:MULTISPECIES: PTS glucose transporter subunit IIA [unclassified Breznakia]|uniref:PTS sugar transporter subunit IIA n=1 Tax=unclassified Breznakia TaxID=2623764 RepID=UPI00247430E8|nr:MULTISPECIES: PTS glucose transporter subunit IIA [unclassified Breznakia]MDH6366237.1 PTS system glucose-specific IIA component [Breznakia sp. PH1-1]MDH6403330.1 PTS system glucose-specific IIA component [Breznakia sp. PF1-11]MDH6411039.1 PTS system glucose-specific IIA component [Breznakia sp. PFB1-11]MDH6413403.1 PTS system glucose-specific IIA component [Breznakia sp. PFB1-14]MDH6416168.1 PTS system glucose-specific IIA component [Breznakia sp. PFB1-4]